MGIYKLIIYTSIILIFSADPLMWSITNQSNECIFCYCRSRSNDGKVTKSIQKTTRTQMIALTEPIFTHTRVHNVEL